MKSLLIVVSSLLCTCISALADEGQSRFQWTNGYEWGGQTLVAPRAVFCSTVPIVKFQKAAPKTAHVLYGSLPVGDKKLGTKLGLAFVRAPGQAARAYLDANNDRAVTGGRGQRPQSECCGMARLLAPIKSARCPNMW
ncbi:MAG: hypothetical protein M3347_11035 [Armatimonadota bacterium]|nr:hypothetical protein [Armatimonadota bacterium]